MNSETIELVIVISSAVYVIILFLIVVRKAIRQHLANKYGYGLRFPTLEDKKYSEKVEQYIREN